MTSCLSFQVLETCVKNCGHRFHVLVASQDFVEGVLVRTILPKNNPPTIVHDKVLTLIQVSVNEMSCECKSCSRKHVSLHGKRTEQLIQQVHNCTTSWPNCN